MEISAIFLYEYKDVSKLTVQGGKYGIIVLLTMSLFQVADTGIGIVVAALDILIVEVA